MFSAYHAGLSWRPSRTGLRGHSELVSLIPSNGPHESKIEEAPKKMNVEIIYGSPSMCHQIGGSAGRFTEPKQFASVEQAQTDAFPTGFNFAQISTENGYYVYHSHIFGWEYFESAQAIPVR
jgi:hypothetical protein